MHSLRSIIGGSKRRREAALCRDAVDGRWYLEQNPDIAARRIDPLDHYLARGAAEGRNPNPFFDTTWYLEQYPDVASSSVNPLVHYLEWGAAEGRDPSPRFHTAWYARHNPDVAEAGMNPLLHYLERGLAEGREPRPQHADAGAALATASPRPPAGRDGAVRLPGFMRRFWKKKPRVDLYRRWIEARVVGPDERAYLTGVMAGMERRPVFSVVLPTYRSDPDFLAKAIDSVLDQVYPDWELCIVDDGSGSPALEALLRGYADRDPRLKLRLCPENRGIAAASNVALDMATGEFIALLDHDDELAPHALFAMADAVNRHPAADMLYSDEDKISMTGVRSGPFFKPDWSPEFMWSCMYTCHLGVYRRSLVEAVGRFRSAFDFAQDYDLALRISARARAVVHVPDILYHWRITPQSTAGGADAKPTAELAARRAVQASIEAEGLSGRVLDSTYRGMHRVSLDLPGTPLVSIVIPTAARRIDQRKKRWYLLDLLRSMAGSTYRNVEIVLVHNGDIEPDLEAALAAFSPVYVHYREKVFNIARKMNLGVDAASGEYVVLLNDDMTVIAPNWLEEMLMWFSRPGVAGVGAKLLFPNDTVQHAGVLLLGQGPSHVYYGARRDYPGLVGTNCLVRNYSAVTGACLMARRQDYIDVGGFDPFFRVNYNDIDFCLRLGRRGRIVYTPYALLYHYESVSRDKAPPIELQQFNERWSDIIGADPCYNRNLSQRSGFMDLASHPRRLQDDY